MESVFIGNNKTIYQNNKEKQNLKKKAIGII